MGQVTLVKVSIIRDDHEIIEYAHNFRSLIHSQPGSINLSNISFFELFQIYYFKLKENV